MGTTKNTHFGMSGQLVVMSELLRLGYNVAIPYVDVGEDVFVFDDNKDGELIGHVQVKTATAEKIDSNTVRGQYDHVRRDQLRKPRTVHLYYAFLLLTTAQEWDLIVIRRDDLQGIRNEYDRQNPPKPKPPKPEKEDQVAETKDSEDKENDYHMNISYTKEDARVWGTSLQEFRGREPLAQKYFQPVTTGGGAKKGKGKASTPEK